MRSLVIVSVLLVFVNAIPSPLQPVGGAALSALARKVTAGLRPPLPGGDGPGGPGSEGPPPPKGGSSGPTTRTPSPTTAVPSYLQTVIPGVNLSPNGIFNSSAVLTTTMGGLLFRPSQLALGQWVVWLQGNLAQYVGQPKVTALDSLNSAWHTQLKGQTPLPGNYAPFGSPSLTHFDDRSEIEIRETLALFLKTNAFYTSAMSECKGKPCIQATSGNGWFAKIMGSVNRTVYALVDAEFDDDFLLTKFQLYKTVNGEVQLQTQATALDALTNLVAMLNYYSECLHTIIHTTEYVGGAAFIDASANSPAMRQFASTFAMNVYKTYNDVVGLDLKPGDPTTTPPTPPGVLVGGLFNANRSGILSTLSEVIADWTSYPNAKAWVDGFALAGFGRPSSKRWGLLKAFQAQVDLLAPYANDVIKYMKKNEAYDLDGTEQRLKDFFDNAGRQLNGGKTFDVRDLNAWLQLQAVLSIFHGQTFSFTRFMTTKAAFTAMSPSDTFTPWDSFYYRATSPTIIGAQANRCVMSDSPFQVDGLTDQGLLDVIRAYATKTSDLKTAELAQWTGAGLVDKQGWIVADFFPEGWDGRQLTINSYI